MAHLTHEILEQIVEVLPTTEGDYSAQLSQIKNIVQAHIDKVNESEAQALAEIEALNITDLMALTHKNRLLA